MGMSKYNQILADKALAKAHMRMAAKLSEEGTSMGKPDIGGVKFDDGKPDYTLVPWPLLPVPENGTRMYFPFFQWWRGYISKDEVIRRMISAYKKEGLDFIDQLAMSLNYGATKYEAWNWDKGIPSKRLYAAACRHYKAIYDRGLDAKDEESGLPHTAHLAFYAVAIFRAVD